MIKSKVKIDLENLVCEDFYILNKPMQELTEKYNVTIRVIRHLAEDGFKRLYPGKELNRKRENKYTPEMLDKGVELYKTGKLSFTKIAEEISRLFNVPVAIHGFRREVYDHTDFRHPQDNKGEIAWNRKYDPNLIDKTVLEARPEGVQPKRAKDIASDLDIPLFAAQRSIQRLGLQMTKDQFLNTLPKHTWGELLEVVQRVNFTLPVHGDLDEIIPNLSVDMEFVCHCKKPKMYEAGTFFLQPLASCGCIPVGTSAGEKEVFGYVKSILGPDVVVENKTREIIPQNGKIRAKEIDIYIPSKNLAIEYNGFYFHSDALDPKYIAGELKAGYTKHSYKAERLEKSGIRFFAIFEDEWRDKRDLVKEMLKWRLGLFNGKTIRASKCEIVKMNPLEAKVFFDKYHLQGWTPVHKYILGLKYNGEFVSAIAIRINNYKEVEISRFANNYDYNVHGSFGKLLGAVSERPLVSFSDNQFSTGGIYEKNGFILDPTGDSKNYWYTDGRIRVSRHRCRASKDPDIIAKFPTEKLQAKNGVFSKELFGDERKLHRIDGYGTKKWILGAENKAIPDSLNYEVANPAIKT